MPEEDDFDRIKTLAGQQRSKSQELLAKARKLASVERGGTAVETVGSSKESSTTHNRNRTGNILSTPIGFTNNQPSLQVATSVIRGLSMCNPDNKDLGQLAELMEELIEGKEEKKDKKKEPATPIYTSKLSKLTPITPRTLRDNGHITHIF